MIRSKAVFAAISVAVCGLIIAPVLVFAYIYLGSYISPPASWSTTMFATSQRAFKAGDVWRYIGATKVNRFCRLTVWTIYRGKGGEQKFLSITGINSAAEGRLPRIVKREYTRTIRSVKPGIWHVRTLLEYECGVSRPYFVDTNELTIRIEKR